MTESRRQNFSPVARLANMAFTAQIPDGAVANGNTRGAGAVDWQTVRSAAANVASGNSSVVGGGENNQASGFRSIVVGGVNNAATADTAVVVAGANNQANGVSSWVPGGASALTRGLRGIGVWAAGQIAAVGDAQAEEHVLRRQTADATPTRLTADNAVAGTTNTVNLANFSAISGVLTIIGKTTGTPTPATAVWRLNVSAARGNGVGTVAVLEGAAAGIAPTASQGTVTGWVATIAADTTNGGISVTVTGAAATTINWVARFAAVEVATAS